MTSQRGSRLGGCGIGAAAFVLAIVIAPTSRAQTGFGPDPFQPYNRQYAPYVTPMGPADPMGGGSDPWMRSGRGANQFQQYLEAIAGPGPGRNVTDRAGIGTPYYRSAVNPSWGGGEFRAYQPNARTTPTFEETQRQVADTYFAYLSERDPRKRTTLLSEYRQVRRESDRVINSRAPSPSQVLGSAAGIRRGSASLRGSRMPAENQPPRRIGTPAQPEDAGLPPDRHPRSRRPVPRGQVHVHAVVPAASWIGPAAWMIATH